MTDKNSPPTRLIAALAALGAMAAVALVLNLLGVFKFQDLVHPAPEHLSPQPTIAHIDSREGTIEIRYPGQSKFVLLESTELPAEATLQTQAASAAVIKFSHGPTIRLLPNSRIVTEIDPVGQTGGDVPMIHLTILSGEIAVLESGDNKSFTVSKDGKEIDYQSQVHDSNTEEVPLVPVTENVEKNLTDGVSESEPDLALEQESELATIPITEIPPLIDKANEPADSEEPVVPKELPGKKLNFSKNQLIRSTLTNDDIRSQMKSQAGGFQKCYVLMVNRRSENVLRTNSKDKNSAERRVQELPRGVVSVSFRILESGRVESARIVKSPFADPAFERCVAEALSRIHFKPFTGGTIPIAEFPISLQ